MLSPTNIPPLNGGTVVIVISVPLTVEVDEERIILNEG